MSAMTPETTVETRCDCCGGVCVGLFYFRGRLMFRCRDCGHDQEGERD